MKVWELIEQLNGRDPSGEVVLTLSGDGFNYVAAFDLTPPANRKCVIEADPEDIGVEVDEVKDLRAMVDECQSALQKIMEAQDDDKKLMGAIEEAKEISVRERP